MKRCKGCGQPVSRKHAFGCSEVRAELREKNCEAEPPEKPRRSILSIASLSILGEL